jgi:hypothetical protein
MGGPDPSASATGEGRREWLEKLQRATQQARYEVGDPSDPIAKDMAANLEDLAALLQRELEESDRADSGASGIT